MEILEFNSVFPIRVQVKGDYENTFQAILFLDMINKKVYNTDGNETNEELTDAVLKKTSRTNSVVIPNRPNSQVPETKISEVQTSRAK